MEEVWLVPLAKPFIAPAIDCRDVLELDEKAGGPMDPRSGIVVVVIEGFLIGGGATVRGSELRDELVEPTCLVGDLLGVYQV